MESLSLDRYHFDILMILKETLNISVDIKSGNNRNIHNTAEPDLTATV